MDHRQGTCPSCGHSFRVPASITANKVRCPKCKAVVELLPAPAAASKSAGKVEKRPARARAGAARAGAERAADGDAEGGAQRPGRGRHAAPPKKSPLPLVIGGVAVVALIVAWLFTRGGGAEEPQAAAPAVVQKPDFSALADLEPAEGTSPEAFAQMNELMDKYIAPPFDKNAERAGDLMMHKGKAGIPAIINAFKRIDLTAQEGADVGWKMQTLLLQGLTGANFGWRSGTRADDVAFNAKVIERWFAAWNRAKLDDAAWAEVAQEAGPAAQ